MQSLIFFNKEGDSLNFRWNETDKIWEGDLIFHENSDDTHKTIGLYVLEKIPGFAYAPGVTLSLDKFQLFNEYGINFYGATSSTFSLTNYEVPNSDPKLSSRWIYGDNFDTIFPIGSQVRFEKPPPNFSQNKTYNVHKTKKDAILLLADTKNNFAGVVAVEDIPTFVIGGVNSIGIYNYRSGSKDNLSSWSEPQFYRKYYNDRKLNIINSEKNNKIVSVNIPLDTLGNRISLPDRVYKRYTLDPISIIPNTTFTLKVTLLTDLPTVFTGGLQFFQTTKIIQFSDVVPRIMKPGVRFSVVNASAGLNSNFLTVDNIPNWSSIGVSPTYSTWNQPVKPKTVIPVGFLTIYNNIIYECTTQYTWTATASIFPDNIGFWREATQLPVVEPINDQPLFSGQVQLINNYFVYPQPYTQSVDFTFGSSIDRYSPELENLNINYYYKNNKIYADLIYPEEYAKVEYYLETPTTSTQIIAPFAEIIDINESNIEVVENLVTELSRNFSENKRYDIVFTDIDEFGIEITLNGQIYYEDVEFIFDGINVNMDSTINRTLENWLTKWYVPIANLGIVTTLEYTGKENSIFRNTISFRTEYPNVPLVFSVRVGTTANFSILHTKVLLYNLSSSFSIFLNDVEYRQDVTYKSGKVDFNTTVINFVRNWAEKLAGFDIIVTSNLSMLIFSVKEQDQRFEISVKTGVISLPGVPSYEIKKCIPGNLGCLITSNSVVLSNNNKFNFEIDGFATGQLVTVNNSTRPYNNNEYNIEFLGSQSMNLSYQGPFWPTTTPYCDVAPFSTLGFAAGFNVLSCTPSIPRPANPGDFAKSSFASSFKIQFGASNSYTMSYIGRPNHPNAATYDFDHFVDIKYLNSADRIYVLSGTSVSLPSDSRLISYDSRTNDFIDQVVLPFSGQPKFMVYNPVNNFLYCISSSQSALPNATVHKAYVVDPYIPKLEYTFTFSASPFACEVNADNGDFYVTYGTNTTNRKISVWSKSNFTSAPTFESNVPSLYWYSMVFNPVEKDMYVKAFDTANRNWLLRYNGTTRLITSSFSFVVGETLRDELYYGPWNSSIYAFGIKTTPNSFSGILNLNGNALSNFATYSPNTAITSNNGRFLVYDLAQQQIQVSSNAQFDIFDLDGNPVRNVTTPNAFGPSVYNLFDGDTYIAHTNQRSISVMDKFTRAIKFEQTIDGTASKIIYNPDRKSIYGIVYSPSQPTTDRVSLLFEMDVTVSTSIVVDKPGISQITADNLYGNLDPNYSLPKNLWLKAREYVRRPRENFNDEPLIDLIFQWENDDVKDIFLYDYTGDQLSRTASVPYTGPRPFPIVSLNTTPNTKPDRAGLSEYQQTIFESLKFTLDHVDSETNTSNKPTPLQVYIGCNSKNEGVMSSILYINKREPIDFTIVSASQNSSVLQFTVQTDRLGNSKGYILLNSISFHNFRQDSKGITRGLKAGQLLKLTITDATNQKNKYISYNSGITVEISEVFSKYLIVNFIDRIFIDEFTQIDDYPFDGDTTYLQTRFQVVDRPVAKINVKVQTEIEDIRYKIELANNGQLVNPDDIFIYKEYDINEQGVDWTYLNKKRKELLMTRNEIFPYIGSYKSIINSINHFGYNDLELYEYYRNVEKSDIRFESLFKVEIPDIFDNTIKGWSDKDFLKYTLPNPRYEETNLFNLTFKITDKEGTNILLYSLSEVLMKLQGLKIWLENKIIPITHRILDITGRADFVGVTTIQHKNYDAKILNIKQDFTPIDFTLSEAYLAPVNSGSTVYTCRIDFYVGAVPTHSVMPDYFKIKIKTYKTYKEWNPFTTYNHSDIVSYYGKFYTSVIGNNKLRNPRKYENLTTWTASINFTLGQYINYDREIYQYINATNSYITFGSQSNVNPFLDIKRQPATASWLYMTEWKLVDMMPVQTLSEFRIVSSYSLIEDLPILLYGEKPKPQYISQPYNFTIDTNIDPFVIIELTSDNGYGQTFTMKKNYEIRSIKDLADPLRYPEPLLPFSPIVQLTRKIE